VEGGYGAALEVREVGMRRGGGLRREEVSHRALMGRRLRRHNSRRWLGVALMCAAEMMIAVWMVRQRARAAFM